MDVVFDWNLGNKIHRGLITLRLCGFPFVEIEVVSSGMFQRRDNIEIEHHLLVAHVVVLLFAGEKLFLRAMQKSQIAKKRKKAVSVGSNLRRLLKSAPP
jgi:hypothetical protein